MDLDLRPDKIEILKLKGITLLVEYNLLDIPKPSFHFSQDQALN